jgi:hypothetical protein
MTLKQILILALALIISISMMTTSLGHEEEEGFDDYFNYTTVLPDPYQHAPDEKQHQLRVVAFVLFLQLLILF